MHPTTPARYALLVLCAMSATALAPRETRAQTVFQTLLDVTLEDKTPGQPIGTGGAAANEPAAIGALIATVQTDPTGNHVLRVDNDLSSTSARRLRFDLLDNVEITRGVLVINATLKPAGRDRYSILLRESDGSSRNFAQLNLSDQGGIAAGDAAGTIAVAPFSYAAGDTLRFELTFDLDAGTHSARVNGTALYADRAHGIVDRGIGRLLIGYQSNPIAHPFDLDDVLAVHAGESEDVFVDGFEVVAQAD